MKKTILLLTLLMLLVITVPVAAKYFEPAGDRMWVSSYDGCVYFTEDPPAEPFAFDWPANSPFYISHGWWLAQNALFIPEPPRDVASAFGISHMSLFELYIDGELQRPDVRLRYANPEGENHLWSAIYNFEDGMTGVHEFMGIWAFPACAWNDIPVSECDDIKEMMTIAICTTEVTFTE
jgi:hypothetical protein